MFHNYKLLYFLISVTFFTTVPLLYQPVSAQTQNIVFEDFFNNNQIDGNWIKSGFVLEESGSQNTLDQLNATAENMEVKISGTGFLGTQSLDSQTVGWIGKALETTSPLQPNLNLSYRIESMVRVKSASSQFQVHNYYEFDENNRIIFSLVRRTGVGVVTQFVFDENDQLRCVGSPNTSENMSGCIELPFSLNFDQEYLLAIDINFANKKVSASIDGQVVHAGTYKGTISDFVSGFAASVREPVDSIDSRFDGFKLSFITNATPSLTPTPVQKLNVPDVKQFSAPWGGLVYDNAGKWSPGNPSITRWGCALTSATMLLKYYGFDTDPEKLNNWLKTEKDGYTRNGGIMWPAITRWAKQNKGSDKPSLEFSYHDPSDNFLSSEIEASRPPILKMQKVNGSTHFLVATGKSGTDFNVNDPARSSDTINLLSQAKTEWGTVTKIGKFKPSNTDLSYIVLLIEDDFNLKVYDTDNEEIPAEFFGTEDPIIASDDENLNSGETLKSFYYPKPVNGNYKIIIEGNGSYQFDIFVYDEHGEAKVENIVDSTSQGNKDEYLINFRKENINETVVPQLNYSFEAILDDIENLYKSKEIKNNGLYNSVKSQVQVARKHFTNNKLIVSEIHLWSANLKLLVATTDKIEEDASDLLQTKLKLIIDSI